MLMEIKHEGWGNINNMITHDVGKNREQGNINIITPVMFIRTGQLRKENLSTGKLHCVHGIYK